MPASQAVTAMARMLAATLAAAPVVASMTSPVTVPAAAPGAIAITAVVVAATTAGPVRASGPARSRDGLIAAGRKLAGARCGACHALGATGASPHKSAPPLREIARKYPVAGLAEAFAEGITVGHRDMPEFVLEPAEIDALLAFLESLGGR